MSTTKHTETSSQLATAEAELMGKALLPILIAFLFAGYHLLYGGRPMLPGMTVLCGASIASFIATLMYRSLGRGAQVPSWRRAATAFLGLLPYAFALYVIIALGILPIVQLWSVGFAVWPLLGGCFWILVGWRILFAFWLITEQVNKEVQAQQI